MTNGYGREIIEEIGNFARNNQEDYTRMIRIFFKKNDIRNRNSNDLVTVANSVKCGVFLSNNSVQKVQVEIRLSMQKTSDGATFKYRPKRYYSVCLILIYRELCPNLPIRLLRASRDRLASWHPRKPVPYCWLQTTLSFFSNKRF